MKKFKEFINEAKTVKFTFKTERPTGKWKAFDTSYHLIKLDGKQVGSIGDEAPHKIRLMVIKDDIMSDGNKNCPWKWITLKKDSNTMDEAKTWLNANAEIITAKWKLNKLEQ
jgi:hypothetical protein